MTFSKLVSFAILIVAAHQLACGRSEIRFFPDKNPASNTITFAEKGYSPSIYGGMAFMSALVVNSKPLFGGSLGLQFDNTKFDVVNVELGSFFPAEAYFTVPKNPSGLMQWQVKQLDQRTSVLLVTIEQNSTGVNVQTSGEQSLFDISFSATSNDAAENHLDVASSSQFSSKDGTVIYTPDTIRSGTLRRQ